MKSLIKYFSIVCDLLQLPQSFDRVSLQTVKFETPDVAKDRMVEIVPFIPRDYLYYQVHEIEDDSWNYVATVNSEISELTQPNSN